MANNSPLPLREAASWNRTDWAVREAKLQDTLSALDSDRFLTSDLPADTAGTSSAAGDDDTTAVPRGVTDESSDTTGRQQEQTTGNDTTIGTATADTGLAVHGGNRSNRSSMLLFDSDSNDGVDTLSEIHDYGSLRDTNDALVAEDDPVTNIRDQSSYGGGGINDNGTSNSYMYVSNSKQPSVFEGQLPPRHDTSAAAMHHTQQQQQHLPSHNVDVGSCGSSIITTELHSLGGANNSVNEQRDRDTTAAMGNGNSSPLLTFQQLYKQQQGQHSDALAIAGQRVPPARVTPATTSTSNVADSASLQECIDPASVAGTTSTHYSRSSQQYSDATENESLAWRRALEDGPGRIRTPVETSAAAAASATASSIGNGWPPLGHAPSNSSDSKRNVRDGYGRGAFTCSSRGSYEAPCAGNPHTPSLSAILSQNRTLQDRVAQYAQRMEEMAVAEAEAREELALVRAQYGEGGAAGGLLLSLDELRGEILHRTREELASASGEVVRLRTQLEDVQANTKTSQATLSVENDALREEVRTLSAQLAGQAVLGPASCSNPTAASAVMDQSLVDRVTSAEATAAELRRQLEGFKDKAELEADCSSRAKRERDALQEEAVLATERLAAARNETRDVRRDRDGLRGELTELLRARKNPERTMEKEFSAEADRLRRLADHAKDDAKRREQELDRLQLQRMKDLETARQRELQASKDAQNLRHALKALVDQLRSLERAGELGSVGVSEIVKSSQVNLNTSLDGILRETPSGSKKELVSALTQTDGAPSSPPISPKEKKNTESIGINTTVTASVAANLYAEGLQTRSDLHAAELRMSQLQSENSNLKGKCEHIEGLLKRFKEQKQQEHATLSDAKAKDDEDQVRRLSSHCDDLKNRNALLEQDNSSLMEAKAYIENQNRKVVKRSVELEQIADEAEIEIERLTKELDDAKARIEQNRVAEEEVKDLEDDKYRMQAEWEEARRECELRQQELLDVTERLEELKTREKELNARIEAISKSKIDYEWQCSNLREENAALNEQLARHGSDADASDEKYNVVVMEKLDLERELKECREEVLDLSQARSTAEGEASRVKMENASLTAELEACTVEMRSVKGEIDSIIDEKTALEQKLGNLEAQCKAYATLNSDAKVDRDRLRDEVESMTSQLTTCEEKLSDVTNRLDDALDENRTLQAKVAESAREWKDVCVQASMLIQSPEAQAKYKQIESSTATSPLPTVVTQPAHVQTDAWMTPGPSSSSRTQIDAHDLSSNEVSTMRNVLAEIQSSLAQSKADTEETLLKSRLASEKELESLRISLETAEEHIRMLRLKAQPPDFTVDEHNSTVANTSFDERILRIKECREKAILARAYNDKLADLASPDRKESAKEDYKNNHGSLLQDNRQQRSQRRAAVKRSLADLRSMRTPGHSLTMERKQRNTSSTLRPSLAETTNNTVQPAYSIYDSYMSPSSVHGTLSASKATTASKVAAAANDAQISAAIGTPLDAKTARLDFSQTEEFVLSLLDSVGKN